MYTNEYIVIDRNLAEKVYDMLYTAYAFGFMPGLNHTDEFRRMMADDKEECKRLYMALKDDAELVKGERPKGEKVWQHPMAHEVF